MTETPPNPPPIPDIRRFESGGRMMPASRMHWGFVGQPGMDAEADRVARWFMQWPESIAFQMRTSVERIAQGTELSHEAVNVALLKLTLLNYLVTDETEDDGSFWFTTRMVPPNYQWTNAAMYAAQQAAKTPPVPPEKRRNVPLGLRWDILVRDDHTCRGCGAKAADGIALEIDHIRPFSKNGLTAAENLQVLCKDCNRGKVDKWTEPGE